MKMKAAAAEPYALDLAGTVSFLADRIDRAAPTPLSIRQLAFDYQHIVTSDFTRVRLHEGATSDYEAKVWLLHEAARGMGKALSMITADDGDTIVGFAPGMEFKDLRWKKKKVHHIEEDIHAVLRDPFNPMSGKFSDNVRTDTADDLTELTASLRDYGWIPEFPAIMDERKVVLVGHRRLRVAAALGIEPVIKTLTLGQGDAADAVRFKLAVASNIGGKPFSAKDRKEIAAYLYDEREWSQERIAEALNVTQMTISRDLNIEVNPRPERGGRPRGTKRPGEVQRQASINIEPENWEAFRAATEAEGTSMAAKSGELVREWLATQGATEAVVAEPDQPVVAAEPDHICTCPVCQNRHRRGVDEG